MSCLPISYWCHLDHPGAEPGPVPVTDFTTVLPGVAVEWVRDSVREVSASLDRETFHFVRGWLGNHRAVQAAVVELRRGQPYTFAVPVREARWTWTAYRVSVLPLVSARTKELAARGTDGTRPVPTAGAITTHENPAHR